MSRILEIQFGTVYKPQDRINPQTNLPFPQYQKYLITDLATGNYMQSNWINETGENPRLAIGGSHSFTDIVEILGVMKLQEVINLAKIEWWFNSEVEKIYQVQAERGILRVTIRT